MIIHIFTKSNSNEIQGFVVVLKPLQLNWGCIVERHRDHVRLLHNLPDGMTLAQKIVASSVLPITEIIAIEDHKVNNTFLHVTFRSQSRLRITSDLTRSDTN
jgi:inner membrane protein involved in colicin E2 resistance